MIRSDDIRERKIDRLKESLAATVTMVRQLGIEDDEALRVFRELLEQDDEPAQDRDGSES